MLEFIEGTLPASAVVEIERHMAACAHCRRWISELGRDSSLTRCEHIEDPIDRGTAKPPSARQPGARVGRYIVQGRVGAGAMGVVYAAYDPELDRRVALKLMNPDVIDGSDATDRKLRLHREAQAMARLSHPHVVSVYDVGELDDQVFIAMEFIDGTSLREWLAASPRSWHEVLAALRKAGQGLAAAHESGLVHRDFKLDNVLVSRDGRVCVTDFGLARPLWRAESAPPGRAEGSMLLELELTKTGSFLGTPVYMAPEVLEGGSADALSDQFSYCVALYEALFRQRPFSANDLASQMDEKRRGALVPAPRGSPVPRWLRRVVQRGLRPQRALRYESMAALLVVLGRDPDAARRRWLLAFGGFVTIAALLLGVYFRVPRPMCRGAEQRLIDVWDDTRRGAVRASLLATGTPLAEDVWTRARSLLDAYRSGWIAMNTEACEATRVQGTQSDAILSLRMDCLDRRLDELKALTELLARPDAGLVAHALTAAYSLTPLEVCRDRALLTARVPPPEDPILRRRVDEIRLELARGHTLDQSGRFADGLQVAARAATAAGDVPYRPLAAELLLLRGLLESHAGHSKIAERILLDAIAASESSRHDEIAARAWIELLDVVRILRPADSQMSEALAGAAVERLGGRAVLRARLLDRIGSLRMAQGKYPDAAACYRQALALSEDGARSDDRLSPEILGHLAVALGHLGQSDEKLAVLRRALQLQEKALGLQHPLLGELIERLADALADRGEYAAAEAMYRRALALRESGLEPTDPRIAESLTDLALLLYDTSRNDAALPLLFHALRINEQAFGPEHPDVAAVLDVLGLVLTGLRQLEAARDHLARALKIREKALGSDHPLIEKSLDHLARVQSELGDNAAALAGYQRALTIGEKALGAESPELFFTLMGIGRAYLQLKQPRLAVGPLTRACKLGESLTAQSLAECRYRLGIALWRAGGEPAAVKDLFQRASVVFRLTPKPYKPLLASMQSWLARHGT